MRGRANAGSFKETQPMSARISAFVVALVLATIGLASAQTEVGKIAGMVTDQQGGFLPGVTVTATSVATRASRTTVTDSGGKYVIPSLLPGAYEIRFELSNFHTSVVQAQLAIGAEI